VSGISSDRQELLNKEAQEPSAATAIDLFCYQARKYLGALAAALGGLDTLIFTGGIGENATAVRQRICQDMEFLGIYLNLARNQTNAPIISSEDSPVTVRVMKTDEERMIARHTFELLNRQEVNLDKSPPINV
jgi:acetate kinase